MMRFTDTETLFFVEIDIVGEFLRAKSGNRFLIVVTDHFTKLTKKISLNRVTKNTVAQQHKQQKKKKQDGQGKL